MEVNTFSQANSTGAVARPSRRSVAVGLPMACADDTKSSRSSTSWNDSPTLRPYWNASSHVLSSAPLSSATCRDTSQLCIAFAATVITIWSEEDFKKGAGPQFVGIFYFLSMFVSRRRLDRFFKLFLCYVWYRSHKIQSDNANIVVIIHLYTVIIYSIIYTSTYICMLISILLQDHKSLGVVIFINLIPLINYYYNYLKSILSEMHNTEALLVNVHNMLI